MAEPIQQTATVDAGQHGLRLDQAAAELFADFSRARLQVWIRDGSLRRNGGQARPRDRVAAGDQLLLLASPAEQVSWAAESIGLTVVYEDEALLVVDKPAGLVVYPAAGHPHGTLVNALLKHRPELDKLPRAGIVHRLDMDTSGLLVVAASLPAHAHLVEQFRQRKISRNYAAVCTGVMTSGGSIDAPIGRHPRHRTKMAVAGVGGKRAITHYRLARRFAHHTQLEVQLETGRTHQIRVHMAHLRHPLVGDKTYAGRPRAPSAAAPELLAMLREFPRQALHARSLGLVHPLSRDYLEWQAPLPSDMADLLDCLERYDGA